MSDPRGERNGRIHHLAGLHHIMRAVGAVTLILGAPMAQAAQALPGPTPTTVIVDISEGGHIGDITLRAGVPVKICFQSISQAPGDVFSPELLRLGRLNNPNLAQAPIKLAATESAEVSLTPDKPEQIDLVLSGFTSVPPLQPHVRHIRVVG